MMMQLKTNCLSVLFAVLITVTVPVHAATLGLHLISMHSNQYVPRNDNNLGVYLVKNIDGAKYAAGVYHNSEFRTSAYVARVFELNEYLLVSAGVVTGYRAMLVAPLLTISTHVPLGERSRLRLHLAPKAPTVAKSATAIHASLEFDF